MTTPDLRRRSRTWWLLPIATFILGVCAALLAVAGFWAFDDVRSLRSEYLFVESLPRDDGKPHLALAFTVPIRPENRHVLVALTPEQIDSLVLRGHLQELGTGVSSGPRPLLFEGVPTADRWEEVRYLREPSGEWWHYYPQVSWLVRRE